MDGKWEFGIMLPTSDAYSHRERLVARSYEFSSDAQTTEVKVEFPSPEHLLRRGLAVHLSWSVSAK